MQLDHEPSVPSFLTGTLPVQHGVYQGSSKDEAGVFSDVLPESALTLAEVFQSRGYEIGAFVKNAQLRRGLGIEQGFEVYQDSAGDAREIRWRASDWLDEVDAERPFSMYLHFLDAHWPYPVRFVPLFIAEHLWSVENRRELTRESVDDLRAIGYAGTDE